MFEIIALAVVCTFVYVVVATAVGQVGYKVNYNKCTAYSHGECGHGFWYFLGAVWPLTAVAFAIYFVLYYLLIGPIKIGNWIANAATNWKVFS